MEGLLKKKQEEIKDLEKRLFEEKKAVALKRVNDSLSKTEIFERVRLLFLEKLENIDVISMEMFNYRMTSRLQGGPTIHELFKITFKHTQAYIKCEFGRYEKCRLYCCLENDKKFRLVPNDSHSEILMALFGETKHRTFTTGMLMSLIGSVVYKYLKCMHGTEVLTENVLGELWGNVYSLN